MGWRWRRRAVGARQACRIAAAILAAFVAAAPAGTRAEGGSHPLRHHAAVLNGRLVGSAFAISDGLAVTNRHVVEGLHRGDAVTLIASGGDRAAVEARLAAVSPRMDLAVLRVPPGFLAPVPPGDAPARAGLAVSAAGIDAAAGLGARREVRGAVLAPRAELAAFGPGLIARLPGARPGFSGGPLLDDRGRLVGMVTAIRPGGGRAVAAAAAAEGGGGPATEAFALRAAVIRAEVRRLMRGRR